LNPLGDQAPDRVDDGSPQHIEGSMPDTQQSNAPAAHQTTQEAPAIAEAQLGQVYKISSTP